MEIAHGSLVKMDTPPPVVPAPLNPIRADLLSSAIQFLTDGAVNTAPLSTKIAFLEGKGLSKEEIELALLKADNSGSLNTIQQGYSIKGFLITSALILGTGSLILSNYTTIKVNMCIIHTISFNLCSSRKLWRVGSIIGLGRQVKLSELNGNWRKVSKN